MTGRPPLNDHESSTPLINDQASADNNEALAEGEAVESTPSDTEYRVGPGHPPKQYQFRKGQSGNILGAKVRKRSPVPNLKGLLEGALNQKLAKRQGEKLLTKAAAGMQQLVDQFAQGDPRARRDLIHICERLGVDLTAGQHDALQKSVVSALTQNDHALIDAYIEHYLAEREAAHQDECNYTPSATSSGV